MRQNATEEMDYVCDNIKLHNKTANRGGECFIFKPFPVNNKIELVVGNSVDVPSCASTDESFESDGRMVERTAKGQTSFKLQANVLDAAGSDKSNQNCCVIT